ncbi:hypothetical protein SAMN05192574_102178 [Mucilaginibacter gossypiicola]|uniref:Uncharacterized protein n=1 Tax=Mucilaginibacter gossypiicola TaxID=551995 RepID=A0A1H8D2C8_9SPHI|nr:hypothetical protein [Mucilaginibacter gossypiicola]SEN01386.1 hypothetical protein SAMN05192574_102178 [Mucilaginibacter gossypiicola]
MDAKKALPELPEFGSLTEIMERFKSVPYDQFQHELNDWFTRNLATSQDANSLQILENSGLGNIPALVSEIYHRAELQHALSEAKITTGNEEK